ncbi:DUF2493 domain-containing protein [bacterium]|nr:DUF2493 domain-containing protein [bacterium]
MHVAIINGQTWLICGGRTFSNQAVFDNAMSDLVEMKGMPAKVVHGGAPGADTMAAVWASRHAIECRVEFADWAKLGRAAGPIRNKKMIDVHKPDLTVAFPGGRGTSDMIRRAEAAQIDVAHIHISDEP